MKIFPSVQKHDIFFSIEMLMFIFKWIIQGKGPHLRWRLVAQPSSTVSLLRLFSAIRWMPGDLCTVPGIISLSPLSLADKRNWCDTRGKWPLARNPDRSWWHSHTSLKLFWPYPMAPLTTEGKLDLEWRENNGNLSEATIFYDEISQRKEMIKNVWHGIQKYTGNIKQILYLDFQRTQTCTIDALNC